MKALSLWQPWASALFTPLKRYETRHWPAPRFILGTRIAIHAAKNRGAVVREFWEGMDLRERAIFGDLLGIEEFEQLPFGAVIGTALLARRWRCEDLGIQPGSDDYEWGNHTPGRFAWECSDPVRFAVPIPCVGRQGIFNVELSANELEQHTAAQLAQILNVTPSLL